MTTVPPDLMEMVNSLQGPISLHAQLIDMAEHGLWTILDLFDTLPWFRTGADWTAWRAFLCALFGLAMTEVELAIYRACTGRVNPPARGATEAWVAVGRRGRKSAIAALVGIWFAAYGCNYSHLIAPGETARVLILSKNKDDAKQIHSYAAAILGHPDIAYLLDGKPLGESIQLNVPAWIKDAQGQLVLDAKGRPQVTSYKVELIIRAATIMAGRTRTVLAALLDEVAFFRSDESANPDKDIIAGIRPAMSTIPGALLLGLSSPYARRGVLWDAYEENWAKDGPVLFWKAPTLVMHDSPQIQAHVELETERDPTAASAEYGAEFRKDVEAFISIEAVKAATAWGRFENQPITGAHYMCFVDPSGGTGDPMTAAVGHWDGHKAVVDFLWEVQPPFEPSKEVGNLARLVSRYGVRQVMGDHWGGEWPSTIFRENHLVYYVSEHTKSTLYQNALPWLNSGGVELLDHKRLRQQLVGLDRRAPRGGRDSIDHAPQAHDDLANAACGLVCMLVQGRRAIDVVVPEALTTDDLFARRIHKAVWERLKMRVNPYAKGGR